MQTGDESLRPLVTNVLLVTAHDQRTNLAAGRMTH
jgi:hypothetical protein